MEYHFAVSASAAEQSTAADILMEVPHNVVVDRGLGRSEIVRVVAADEGMAIDLINAMNDEAFATLPRIEAMAH
ncbi:hypothetical protein [Ralstonia pseudosolanacearum]|uniref:hypothetical protein n=1 Tax=Ralstonia pseudosolanacearum TaxID=1310165 RepID=UPI003CF4D0DD